MVLNKGFNIRDAAHRLKIKTTTAQNILRKYNSTG
jgi:transposase